MHALNLGSVLQNGMRRQIFKCSHPLPSDKEVQYQTVAETSPSNLAEAVDVRGGSYSELNSGQRSSTGCVSLIVCETSTMRRPEPNLACCATEKYFEDLIASHAVPNNLQV